MDKNEDKIIEFITGIREEYQKESGLNVYYINYKPIDIYTGHDHTLIQISDKNFERIIYTSCIRELFGSLEITNVGINPQNDENAQRFIEINEKIARRNRCNRIAVQTVDNELRELLRKREFILLKRDNILERKVFRGK